MLNVGIKWLATLPQGGRELVHADTPGEARRVFNEKYGKLPSTLRLFSGFPRLYAFDLIFGETVFRRDLFPAIDSNAWVLIESRHRLEEYLCTTPEVAVFVPPFRATPASPGQWRMEG
jgi:hypothetical protein